MNRTKITPYFKLFILVFTLLFVCSLANAAPHDYHKSNSGILNNPLTEPSAMCSATPGLCLPGAKYPVELDCSYKLEPNPHNNADTLLTMTCSVTNNTNQILTDEYQLNQYYVNFYSNNEKPIFLWLRDISLAGINPGETLIEVQNISITPWTGYPVYEDGFYVSRGDKKLLSPAWSTGPFILEGNNVLDATRETLEFSRVQQTKTLQIAPGRFLHFAEDLVGHNIEISGLGEKYQEEIETSNYSDATSFWMFGRTPDCQTEHWYNFTFDGETGAKFKDGKLILCFVDGKRGDMDIAANGQISYLGGTATQYQDALYFPVPSIPDENSTVRLTIIEQGIRNNQTKLTFYDQEGETINQRTLDINGRGTLLIDDIPDTTSLIMVNGYLLTGYVTVTFPEGETFTAEAVTEYDTDFPIPFASTTDSFDTYITITNPTDVFAPVNFNKEINGTRIDYMGVLAHTSRTYHVKPNKAPTFVNCYPQTKVAVSVLYRVNGTDKDSWSMANLSNSRSKRSKFPVCSQDGSWTAYLGINSNSSTSTLHTAAGEKIEEAQPILAIQSNNNYYQGGLGVFGPSNATWADVEVGNSERSDYGNATVVVGSASGGIGAYLPLQKTIKRGVMPLLPANEGVTVCNLINPNFMPSEVSVQAYDKEGEFVGGGVISIQAHGSLSVPITDPGNIAMILFLAVDQPIIGNEIFQYKSGDIAVIPLLSGYW